MSKTETKRAGKIMIKFLKLNEVCGHGDKPIIKPVFLNPAHIQHITLGSKGRDTHVRMSDRSFFFVRESLAEIETLLMMAKPVERGVY